jgi:enoyl-CoA hydratase
MKMIAEMTMTLENVLTSIDNEVLTITMNRPKQLNALNAKTIAELKTVFTDAIENSDVKAIIITGAGDKAFVAGADIKEFTLRHADEGSLASKEGHDVFNLIENCPKPVIAAVNGFALGGGCELSMACHLRIASENARFGQPEVSLGLIAGYGGTQRLIQYIGKSKAMEMHLTADMISADEALKLGLVNYVVPQDKLIEKCLEIIKKIKSKSPLAITAVINSVNAYFKEGVNGFDTEIEEFGKCFKSEDFKEGAAAFIEKRQANFTGK